METTTAILGRLSREVSHCHGWTRFMPNTSQAKYKTTCSQISALFHGGWATAAQQFPLGNIEKLYGSLHQAQPLKMARVVSLSAVFLFPEWGQSITYRRKLLLHFARLVSSQHMNMTMMAENMRGRKTKKKGSITGTAFVSACLISQQIHYIVN